MAHIGVHCLKQNYVIDETTKILGSGSYGKVFLSSSKADPSFKVAIKVLNKERLGQRIKDLKAEIKILH